jgi:hypothetical protein
VLAAAATLKALEIATASLPITNRRIRRLGAAVCPPPVGYLESLSKKKLGMLFPMQLGHMVVVRIVHRSMALHAAAITAAAATSVAVLVFAWQVELS